MTEKNRYPSIETAIIQASFDMTFPEEREALFQPLQEIVSMPAGSLETIIIELETEEKNKRREQAIWESKKRQIANREIPLVARPEW